MSAESAQHREGQLPSQPQTVCPPSLGEALQGPPFPDQQGQEQLLPCGCHPAELCTTVIAPLATPSHTSLQPLNICSNCCITTVHFSHIVDSYLYLFIFKVLSIFIVFISYHV